jgi:hypothetical protein
MDDSARWWPEYLSGASNVVAWLALLVAISGNRISRRALALAAEKASREMPRLVVYLADGLSLTRGNHREVRLIVSVSNPSDSDNSIARADLVITHVVAGSTLTRTIIEASTATSDHPDLRLPTRIPAHDTVAGQLTFRVPTELVRVGEIRQYALELADAQGSIAEAGIGMLREVTHAE